MNLREWRKRFNPSRERQEERAEQFKDAITCVNTSTWHTFKERLRKKARESLFKPGMNNEQAATLLIKQTVYNEVLEVIEQIERATKEKVSNVEKV